MADVDRCRPGRDPRLWREPPFGTDDPLAFAPDAKSDGSSHAASAPGRSRGRTPRPRRSSAVARSFPRACRSTGGPAVGCSVPLWHGRGTPQQARHASCPPQLASTRCVAIPTKAVAGDRLFALLQALGLDDRISATTRIPRSQPAHTTRTTGVRTAGATSPSSPRRVPRRGFCFSAGHALAAARPGAPAAYITPDGSWKQNWRRPPPSQRLLARIRLAARRREGAQSRRCDRVPVPPAEGECDCPHDAW